MHTVHVSARLREMMTLELITPVYAAKLVQTLLERVAEDPRLFGEQAAVIPGDESGVWLNYPA